METSARSGLNIELAFTAVAKWVSFSLQVMWISPILYFLSTTFWNIKPWGWLTALTKYVLRCESCLTYGWFNRNILTQGELSIWSAHTKSKRNEYVWWNVFLSNLSPSFENGSMIFISFLKFYYWTQDVSYFTVKSILRLRVCSSYRLKQYMIEMLRVKMLGAS